MSSHQYGRLGRFRPLPLSAHLSPQRLSGATIQTLATAIAGHVLVLASAPLLARLLGIDDRGHFAWLYVIAVIVSTVGNLGVAAACTFYVSRYPGQTRAIVREVSLIFAIQAPVLMTVVAAILFASSAGKPSEVGLAIYPMLLFVPASLAESYALAVLLGQRRFSAFNVVRLLPGLFYTVGVTVLFVLGEDALPIAVAVLTGTYVIALLVTLNVALSHLPPSEPRMPGLRRGLVSFGFRSYFSALSPADGLPLDQFLIGAVLSPVSLGLYAVASAFRSLPRFLADTASIVVYPTVASQGETPASWRLVWRFTAGATFAAIVVVGPPIVLMPWLIELLFGAEFSDATRIAQILLVAGVLAASRRVLAGGLIGLGHPSAPTLGELAMYPWLAVGVPIFITRWDAEGLAAALAIGLAVSLAVTLGLAFRLYRRLPLATGEVPSARHRRPEAASAPERTR